MLRRGTKTAVPLSAVTRAAQQSEAFLSGTSAHSALKPRKFERFAKNSFCDLLEPVTGRHEATTHFV